MIDREKVIKGLEACGQKMSDCERCPYRYCGCTDALNPGAAELEYIEKCEKARKFTFSEYQTLARRTQNPELGVNETLEHALWGLASECGEVCGLFQKRLQGHTIEADAVRKEIGDVLWMLAELCDVLEMDLGQVAEENIEKLKRRYPNGFEAWRSVGRGE